jgi:hypothetical protein
MKRVGWVVLVAATCAAAAVLWWRSRVDQAQPSTIDEPTHLSPTIDPSGDAPAIKQKPAPPPQNSPSPVQEADYAAQLHAALDYLEFARSLLNAARAGDHAAQFYIFRALDYCAMEYRAHVDRGRIRRSLDDALTWAATHWPYDAEAVRLIYTRCHTFMESGAQDLGERGEWLRKASDGGFPLAQAIAANRQPLKGVGTSDDDAARAKERRRLLSLAIRSREPQVLWEIASSPLGVELEGFRRSRLARAGSTRR